MSKTSKYPTETKKQAIELLLLKGQAYENVSTITGVDLRTLRMWKHRLKDAEAQHTNTFVFETTINELKDIAEKCEKARLDLASSFVDIKNENNILQNKITSLKVESNELNKKIIALEDSQEILLAKNEDLIGIIDNKENVIDTLNNYITELSTKKKNWFEMYSLPIALLLLHISSIYGVSHVLEMLLHSQIMSILTAVVICSAGLVLFASNKTNRDLAIFTIIVVFVVEAVCNLITIQSIMNIDTYNKISKIGCDPYYIFFLLAVLIPALNLKLEVLLFDNDE